MKTIVHFRHVTTVLSSTVAESTVEGCIFNYLYACHMDISSVFIHHALRIDTLLFVVVHSALMC